MLLLIAPIATHNSQAGRKVLLTPQIERPADQTVIRRLAARSPRRSGFFQPQSHSTAPPTWQSPDRRDWSQLGQRKVTCMLARAETGRTAQHCRLLIEANQDRTEISESESRWSRPTAGLIPDSGNRRAGSQPFFSRFGLGGRTFPQLKAPRSFAVRQGAASVCDETSRESARTGSLAQDVHRSGSSARRLSWDRSKELGRRSPCGLLSRDADRSSLPSGTQCSFHDRLESRTSH